MYRLYSIVIRDFEFDVSNLRMIFENGYRSKHIFKLKSSVYKTAKKAFNSVGFCLAQVAGNFKQTPYESLCNSVIIHDSKK